MAHAIPQLYRQPLMAGVDPLYKRTLTIASIAGLLLLIALLVTPAREIAVSDVEDIPERFAKLILEKPKPVALARPVPVAQAITPQEEDIVPETKSETPDPEPKEPGARKLRDETQVAPTKGQLGRAKAKEEVAGKLAEVTGSLDAVLADLSSSLEASKSGGNNKPERATRRRQVRGARSGNESGAVPAGRPEGVDLAGTTSALAGSQVSIESVGDVLGGGSSSSSGGGSGNVSGAAGGAGASGEYRSNASLLAVVRKYAAGIQFCYDNQLNKSPGLRGKLVVAVTVAPAGNVVDAVIVDDTVRSSGLSACAIRQIQGWKFPRIPEGAVTFKAPFLFTPPE